MSVYRTAFDGTLGEKQAQLQKMGGPLAEELARMGEQIRSLDALMQEIDEAVDCGKGAERLLDTAEYTLRRAVSWSGASIGEPEPHLLFIGAFFWRRKMKQAKAELEQVKASLVEFQRECADIARAIEDKLEIRAVVKFADSFFDDFITDFSSKPRLAREHVTAMLEEVRRMLRELEQNRRATISRQEDLQRQRRELLEKA